MSHLYVVWHPSAGSSDANERAALCALKLLLSEAYPLLEASKRWRLWGGETKHPDRTVLE